MLALFNLGGGEVILLLAMLLLAGLAVLAVLAGIALLIAWLVRRDKSKAAAQPPLGAAAPTPPAPRTCPRCGAIVPAESPQGLCPRCVLGVGLATQTEGTGETGPPGTKAAPAARPPSEIARHFPQLEIIECLGRGGMGVVYKARQPKLDRLVALKILAPEKGGDPKFAGWFLREAQALARLNHPNIVTVHDFGEADGMFFLLMEFVEGVSLRQLLQTGKLQPEEALAIVPKICEALQYAHELGIVHRDIKPENVLLDKQGRVKIADFGIAKILSPLTRPSGALSPSEEGERVAVRGQNLTQDQVVGTPHYMAPEQVEKPQTVDHRADIYSLGVVLYEMLTGELPLGKFAPPSRKVQVDVRLDEVVLHALEKEPDRRYQYAREVKTDVETIAGTAAAPRPSSAAPARPPEPWPASRTLKLALGLGVIGALALVATLTVWLVGSRLSRSGAVAPPPSLVGWWPGEGNAKDIVGGNDGELVGGVSFAPGVVGEGFEFNGAGAYIKVPDSPSLNLTEELTVELWFKDQSTAPRYYGLVAKRARYPLGCNFGIDFYAQRPDGLQVYLRDPNYPSYQVSTCPVPSSGMFHHVAATYRQINANQVELRTFVDGQLVKTAVVPGNLANTLNNAPVTIGADDPDETYFIGVIDEVSLYRRALSADEIQAIYRAGRVGKSLTAMEIASIYQAGRGSKFSVKTAPATRPRVPQERVSQSARLEKWPPTVVPVVAPPPGLVSWWPGEGNAKDIVGGNDGELVGGVSFAPGMVGQAFRFDGLTGCVINDQPGMTSVLDSYTMEFWARPSAERASTPEANSGIAGIAGQRFAIFPHNGQLGAVGSGVSVGLNGVSVFEHGSVYLSSLLVYDAPIRDWTHVVVVYENRRPRLYLNGVLVRVGLASTRSSYPSTWFGESGPDRVNSADGYYAGLLDEVRIYNRPLSPAEIQALYQAVRGRKVRAPAAWSSPPAGCVARWRADGNGRDSVGGNDALLLGGITFAPGQVGQAFRFDGVGGAVQVPAAPALDVGKGNGLTIAAWIKPMDVSVQRPLVEWNDAHGFMGTQFWIAVAALEGGPGSLWGNLVDTDGEYHPISTPTGLVLPNVFQQVALTYDKPSGLAVLYLNGSEVAQANLGSFTPYTSSDLYFGLRPSGVSAGNRYEGLLDEVGIYNRALSPAEIQTLYQDTSGGRREPEQRLSEPLGKAGFRPSPPPPAK